MKGIEMPSLKDLVPLWNQAKADEHAANERRVAIEALIVDLMPGHGMEGTVKENIGHYQVKVTRKITRSVDSDQLQILWPKLSDHAQACFSWKATAKLGELRKVQEFLPEEYKRIADCIEAKPAKPAVVIDALEEVAA
jgi:hypothetical protein